MEGITIDFILAQPDQKVFAQPPQKINKKKNRETGKREKFKRRKPKHSKKIKRVVKVWARVGNFDSGRNIYFFYTFFLSN